MDLGLKGRKAIVTGATKGIGRAIVDLLASEGVDVGLCARTEDEVQEALRALSSRGVTAVGEALNVRDAEAYAGWLGRTASALGGCEALMDHLKKSGQGSVVIISSTNAIETFAAPMGYNAMKAALITYAKQL